MSTSGGGGGPGDQLVDVLDTTSPPNSFMMELSSTDALGTATKGFQYDHIRCVCEDEDDDGFTIQCDECGVWQHALCVGIGKESVPDSYFCELCRPDLHHKDGYWISRTGIVGMMPAAAPGRKRKGSSLVTLASLSKEMSCSEIGENILSKEVVGGLAFLSRRFYGEVLPQMPSIRAVWRKANYEFVEGGIVALPSREALKEACSRPLEIREIRRMQRKATQPRIGLFAGADIDPGTLVTEVVGHVQLPSLLSPLTKGQSLSSPAGNQFILLVPRVRPLLCVDARKFGNPARHVRRSCRPNCELKIVLTGDTGSSQVHFCVFARNALQEGDELFLPLDEDATAALESLGWRVECACGSPDFCLAPAAVLAPLAAVPTTAAVRKSASFGGGGSVSFDSHMQGPTAATTAQPLRAKTPQQQAQQTQSAQTQPAVKLSREDRKLLQYIEHFEKMDQSERKSASRKSSAGPSGMASSTEAVSAGGKVPSSPATSSPATGTGSGSGGARRKTKANAAGSPQKPAKQKASTTTRMASSISEDEHAHEEDTFESSDAGTEERERPLPVKRPATASPKQPKAKKGGPGSPPKKAKTKPAKDKERELPSEEESPEPRRPPKAKSISGGPQKGNVVAFSDDDDESGNVDVDGEDSFTAGIAYASGSAAAVSSSARSSLTTTPPPPASGEAGSATSQQETPSKKRVSLSDYMRMRKSSGATTASRADEREDKEEGELVSPSTGYTGYHHHHHHHHHHQHQKQQEHQYYHQQQQQQPLQQQPYYQPPSSSSTGNTNPSSTPYTSAPSRRLDAPTSAPVSTSSDPHDHPQQPQQRYEAYDRRGYDVDRKDTPPPTAFEASSRQQQQQQQQHYSSNRPASYRERQSSMRDPRDYQSSSYHHTAGGTRHSTASLATEQRDPRDPSYYPPSSSSFTHHSREREYQQQPSLGRSYSSGTLGEGHRQSSGASQSAYRPRPSLLKAAEEVPTRWEEAQAAAAAARKQEDGDPDKSTRWPPQPQSGRYGNYPPPYSGSSGGSGQPPRRQ